MLTQKNAKIQQHETIRVEISPSTCGSSYLNLLRGRVGELLGEGRGDDRGDRCLPLVGEDTSKLLLSFVLVLLSALGLLLSVLVGAGGSSCSGSVIPRAARLAARRSLNKT